VPNFFRTLFRRKLVIWFLIAEILRDYWLSGPYGRNWQFLWAAADVPKWAVVVMIGIFFIGIWGLLMGILIRQSSSLSSDSTLTIGRLLQDPLMAPARLRRRPWRAQVVPDVVGNFGNGSVHPVGWSRRPVHVSLAFHLNVSCLMLVAVPVCGFGSVFSTPCKVSVWV
jgi:hypothetical protein